MQNYNYANSVICAITLTLTIALGEKLHASDTSLTPSPPPPFPLGVEDSYVKRLASSSENLNHIFKRDQAEPHLSPETSS